MARMSASFATAVWLRVLPGAEASVCSLTLMRWNCTEYPPRMVVLPSPNHGSCHEKPMAGPKLFRSRGRMDLSGLDVSGPTNSTPVILSGSHVETGSRGDCCTPGVQASGAVPGGTAFP